MLSDGTRTFTWQHGRQLASMTKNGITWTYTYNADGMRTKRTNGTDTYEYVYNGSQLTQMKYNGSPVDFTYDADGSPLTLSYQGVTYYYVTNVQGDVVGITDTAGNLLVGFEYEAYGSGYFVSYNAEKAALLAQINPLGYRGYVLDVGTNLYYLQSRYYDPELGRFINADGLISTGQGIIGNNIFAYCGNNPVIYRDTAGTMYERTVGGGGGGGGLAYAGGYAPNSTTSQHPVPLVIPLFPPSTTYDIETLRAEIIAIQNERELEETQVVALTEVNTDSNSATFYGIRIYDGKWIVETPPMTYQEAKVWCVISAVAHSYGRRTKWGLYTVENDDAFAMAWDLGFGGLPIPDPPKPGEYAHYHVFGRYLFGFYKHFHVWYGAIC